MNSVFTWPVRPGSQRKTESPPARPVLVYVLACTLGGAATGLALAAAGQWLSRVGVVAYVVLGAVVLLAVGGELRGRVRPLPEPRRQVPRRWLDWRSRSATAAAFGLMIGSGVLTYFEHATAYALAAAVSLSPSLAIGALLGGVYGFSRGAALLVTWIGDRFLGRRLSWDVLLYAQRTVAFGLALLGAVTPVVAVLIVS